MGWLGYIGENVRCPEEPAGAREVRPIEQGRLGGSTWSWTGTTGWGTGWWAARVGLGPLARQRRARGQHVGWSAGMRRRRLQLVVNNQRFCVRPESRRPHLASRGGHVPYRGVRSGTHLEPEEGLRWATVPTTLCTDQEDTMTRASMPLDDLLVELGDRDKDALRVILERTVQALVEAEVTAVIGAGRHERTEERLTYRNGHRPRTLDTRLGRLQLEIPKLRQGSFLPSLLEPRRRIERALWAVIQEAWVHGVSNGEEDDLVAAMVGCQVSKSEVSRICQELDLELAEF